ncbi:winged helix-turn-helix transcriptional regulator [Curtobacterium flaccumfaciens pv. flaccumfaciens]|uniref:winged helix-turn-helix transcriptional regulator n=1 Tax=Curtobacterium flaccumfaciens TaxID=2035 RepID=UPI001BD14BAB|nr:helix-turn-helix domain-containing protein [Curtobacterium flaccumfaciens]QVG65563.1 helix-turn-helix transcriptional regulator [Curtobacterium flaccumfaciens pv. flaccumfaciens]
MRTPAQLTTPNEDKYCSIDRTLGIVGDRWSFLILREALVNGLTKFAEFESALRIAPNILSSRLARMAEAGVLEKREYREAGSRPRQSYHPTDAGRELLVVLGALQQWGDDHIPPKTGITQLREAKRSGRTVRVGFVEDADVLVDPDEVEWPITPAHPSNLSA